MLDSIESVVYSEKLNTDDYGNSRGNSNKPNMKSGRDGPCPICDRVHDQDCHWYSDGKTVLCHTKGAGGTSNVSCPPDSVPGPAGGNYVFQHLTKDFRAGIYFLRIEQFKKASRPATKTDYSYDYADGSPAAKVTRTDKGDGTKKFTQLYFNPASGVWERWLNAGTNPNGSSIRKSSFTYEVKETLKAQVPLYNLPVVMAAIADEKDIWLVEGEGCVDALGVIGIVATTLIGGAGRLNAYNPRSIEILHGARVILCPDRDQKGLAHMEEVAAALNGKAVLLWCYCKPEHSTFWSNLQKAGGLDCKDWLEELGDMELGAKRTYLYDAVGAAKEWNAKTVPQARKDSPDECNDTFQEIPWLALPVINHQIGNWSKPKPIENSEIEQVQSMAKFNPGIKISEVDEEEYQISYFIPKTSFDLSVVKILSSDDGGGLVLSVRWIEVDRLVEREAFIKSIDTRVVKDFVAALIRELKQNVSCTLSQESLQGLLQNRTTQYRLAGGRTYKLADRTGQQDDGTWVFQNCQFAADGSPTTDQDSGWVFNHQLGEEERIPSPKIASQNPKALRDLVSACQGFFNLEILPLAWFVCGYSVATMQRQSVMQAEGNFPQIALFGDPGGGKTTASQVATSLTGMHKFVISRYSESMVYETVKSLGGLPLLLDDPVKKGIKKDTREAIDNFLWAMFNGTTRKVRGNEQTPHSNVIVTTNVSLGEDNQALESRLIKLHFPVKPPNSKGYPALKKAMDGASGGLSELLAIAYDPEAVKDIEARLLEHLPHAHARISSSLALITFFTQRFVDTAGIVFDAFAYCVSHLCPTANDFESDKDSLQDFLEKLEIMKSQGSVGEWNCTPVVSGGKAYRAVYLAEVWGEFDRKFSPNYSRQSLQQLVEGRGGQSATQKFVATKVEWIDYERAIAEHERNTGDDFGSCVLPPCRPKKSAPRKCLLIPESEITSFLGTVPESLPQELTFNEVTHKLPLEATCETQAETTLQPKVAKVTQVTEETASLIRKGAKVEIAATGKTGLVVELEDSFATIKLDTPIQSSGLGQRLTECSLAEIRALPANSNVFEVGDRIRHDSQSWDVDKVRSDGTLDLGHATLLKATSANPAEVELVEQGVAV